MSAADDARPMSAKRSIMPPHRVLEGFLSTAEAAGLLAHAAAREAAFTPTRVGAKNHRSVAPGIRVSTSTRDLGEFQPLLRRRLRGIAAEITAALRLSAFETSQVELELVAHGDGAFYRRHVDTVIATDRAHIRVLSGVYYFHRQPKGFSGGALRLYAIGDNDRFVDIEPSHNSLLLFPSWAPHEVRPVSCPSGQFMDSRFAINCWLYARHPGAAGAG